MVLFVLLNVWLTPPPESRFMATARFNFRKSPDLKNEGEYEGDYQAFIFIKQLKVGGSTMAGVVRQFMYLKWNTTCIEPMKREYTLSSKDGCVSSYCSVPSVDEVLLTYIHPHTCFLLEFCFVPSYAQRCHHADTCVMGATR